MKAATLNKCGDPLAATPCGERGDLPLKPAQLLAVICGGGAATSPLTNVTRARPWGPPRPARKET